MKARDGAGKSAGTLAALEITLSELSFSLNICSTLLSPQ